ncbi:hypothetical protein, partial [Mesorhizobium sp.]
MADPLPSALRPLLHAARERLP